MKDFTLHDRVPLAIPDVAENQSRFVRKKDVVDGKYYNKDKVIDEQP